MSKKEIGWSTKPEKSDYRMIRDITSKCQCGSDYVYLMINTKTKSKLPSFYICFLCESIGEVGVGKVFKTCKNKIL